MSLLAQKNNAINLSQGFPDFPIEGQLSTLLHEASVSGLNQYAPMPGLPALREAIAADFLTRYGVAIDPETEITITPGATYAIYTAFTSLLQAGDEVIVLEPAYDSYIPNIEMSGAIPVPVKLLPHSFRPDWNAIAAAITERTKAIIVNTPHNPTGSVWSAEDWNTLWELLKDRPVYVLSDEVYEQLLFDGRQHYSVLQHPGLRERSFALYSFGKVFHNTGWKIGFAVAPPAMSKAFRRLHQFLSFSVNTPAQWALAQFIGSGNLAKPAALLQQKRDYFNSLMQHTPFRMLAPASGSYFQLYSYEGLSDMSDKDYACFLTEQFGVASIPVSAFYSDGTDHKILRVCFAKKEETLKEAALRLKAVASGK
ncbi:pyridoxal phosphate-dependent aminotransferase [Rurimicrobium arvi]|uniref:Pyridoxal phosphate-dependent aminotransferase n=2 Tax=Rurimicrobium arvi TaxID=2049916 RepID=A0ABP8N224_9BACT